jgi:hypothetical protein
MVNTASNNDLLLYSAKELGIKISKEEIDLIVSEASEKYDVVNIDKMHPLTRAFINLTKNKEKFKSVVVQTP